jgi:uncharacterized membrane protein|nr:hypothetical protein [Kofleriaceae bacterium]
MHDVLLPIHIAAGALALASMVPPLVARKGGALHRRAGWVFVAAMTVVAATAFALSLARLVAPESPRDRVIGLFLFSVSALAAASVSTGVRVLRFKTRAAPHRNAYDLAISALCALAGAATLAYGALVAGSILLAAFGVLGVAIGASQLAYWLRAPRERMHWWIQHMGAMLGGCIAATTALVVTNASRFGAGAFSTIVWLAVPAIGVPAIAVWTRSYRRRFARATATPASRAKAAAA